MTVALGPDRTTGEALPQPARPPLWLVALITLSGTLAMHIFVPALPLAATALGASANATQLTLSTYITGLAVGQLIYGPVSDRFGRRLVLIAGMLLYTAASAAAIFAPTIEILIVARLFQALGGCSGLVLGRAIVRDSATGAEAARKLSLMNLMTMAGPGLSPLIGSALAETTGWRSIFIALTLLGLANLLLILALLRDSLNREVNDTKTVMRNYLALLRSRTFLGYTIGGGCASTALYAYIGAAPFIFVNQLHRPTYEVGAYLAINVAGVWFGSLAASRVVGGISTKRMMVLGNLISCLAATLFLVAALTGLIGVAYAVLPMLFVSFGAGFASPAALTEALGIDSRAAGSASGLYGAAQMAIGAVCTTLGVLGGNPLISTGMVLVGAGMLAQLSFWVANRSKDGI